MQPYAQQLFTHAARQPDRAALIIDQQMISWQALIHEIKARAQHITPPDQHPLAIPAFTVDPSLHATDQALNALAKLYAGQPIIGSTSGSTGAAKAYRRSQASWLYSFQADDQAFGITQSDVILAPGNLSHSLFFYALCRGLFAGATVILSNRFRPDRVWEQIHEHQVTVLYAVPTQLRLLLALVGSKFTDHNNTDHNMSPGLIGQAAPSVRWVLASGAKWFSDTTPALAACFPNATIAEFYGASELSFVSLRQHLPNAALGSGAVGKPFAGVTVAILNSEQIKDKNPFASQPRAADQENEVGQVGTIFVNTPAAFDQYLGSPPEDFYEFICADGRRWLSVGDQGYLAADGNLFITGRLSRKIIVSGKNLYPEEIEQLLQAHNAIDHAAVLGQQDFVRGQKLLAVLQLNPLANALANPPANPPANPGRSVTRGELIEFLRPHLEDFKIPRQFFTLADWPLTASGKTDYAALQFAVDHGLCQPVSN